VGNLLANMMSESPLTLAEIEVSYLGHLRFFIRKDVFGVLELSVLVQLRRQILYPCISFVILFPCALMCLKVQIGSTLAQKIK
jgi:hypothetical protein